MWYDKSMNYVFDKLEVVFEVWGFYVFGVKNEKKEDGKYNVWIWDKIGWFCYLEIIWKCKSFCFCFFLVNVINKFGIGVFNGILVKIWGE